ncbi:uncharacterized protein [Palaemon carinicauda]|uniref:uncharacterized protein n=1 Tax=Palaemon carinicauda TaxID=392227 RepID=UPI0035B5B06A
MYYFGTNRRRNGVRMILSPDFKATWLEVIRVNDRITKMKSEWCGENWCIISVYTPQVGRPWVENKTFWMELDGTLQEVPVTERLLVRRDFNGHIGPTNRGFEEVHGDMG